MKSSSSPWECQIFLRKEVQDNGRPVSGVGREEKFGPAIADKTLLEDMIKRAQLAILNPSIQPHRFVNFDLTTLSQGTAPLGSSRQLGFSPNVVCLDISGPGVTDLAFIDLPGLLSSRVTRTSQ